MSTPFNRNNTFQIAEDHWKAPSRAALRRAIRHTPLPGFPSNAKFETSEEVAAYLTGEKIQCLLCGRSFADLGKHVRTLHLISPDEYREQRGIPWGVALCAEEVSARYSRAVKSLLSAPGAMDRLLQIAALARATKIDTPPVYRATSSVVRNQRTTQIVAINAAKIHESERVTT